MYIYSVALHRIMCAYVYIYCKPVLKPVPFFPNLSEFCALLIPTKYLFRNIISTQNKPKHKFPGLQ